MRPIRDAFGDNKQLKELCIELKFPTADINDFENRKYSPISSIEGVQAVFGISALSIESVIPNVAKFRPVNFNCPDHIKKKF
jgi:hypothetical protein